MSERNYSLLDLFTKVNKKYIEDLIEAGYVEKVEE